MKCTICSKEKLRKEFPHIPLSAECNHPPLYCLRCAVASAKKDEKCPYKDCGLAVDEARIENFEQVLAYLFPKVKSAELDISDIEKSGEQVFVATLDGERTAISYSSSMTVIMLKEQIQEKIRVEINKQKLVYQEKDLEVYSEEGELKVLGDYSIPKGATIHLMVLLYAIPEHMDHVIFDLSWGYPKTGRDFLDATCFIYSNTTRKGTVNYDSKSWPSGVEAVSHSGDGMDDTNRRGYHTIDVSLKKVPADVTHLLFSLSVWSNPSIAHFPSPILRFYDAANKAKDLCNTSLSEASDSEAVVMCYVVRKSNKKGWDIYESGQLSAGNAINYDPLYETLQGIISGRFPAKASKSKVNKAPAAAMSAPSSGTSSGPRPVEIVFSFDTTGSMMKYLLEVRKQVQEIISRLLRDIPSLRIAVFAHGDYCDAKTSYVTKFINFTNDRNSLCNFVNTVEPTHGGDAPECYELVLHEVGKKLSWTTGSNKSLVMIGDATPHDKNEAQNYLHLDWKEEAKRLFKDKGIRIYSVACRGGNSFWRELAVLGHGKYLLLDNFRDIVTLVLAICYREGAPSLLKKFESEMKSIGMNTSVSTMFSELT